MDIRYKVTRSKHNDVLDFCTLSKFIKYYIATTESMANRILYLADAFNPKEFEPGYCGNCFNDYNELRIFSNRLTFEIRCPECGEIRFEIRNDKSATEILYKYMYLLQKGVHISSDMDPITLNKLYETFEEKDEVFGVDVAKRESIAKAAAPMPKTKKVKPYAPSRAKENTFPPTGINDFMQIKEVNEEINQENNKQEEERVTMKKGLNFKSMFKGMEFGAVKGDMFKLSMYGIAFKSGNGYVAYDKNNEEIIDVDAMNFDDNGMIMQMPTAIKSIEAGDIILHQGNPVIVNKVRKNGQIEVLEPGVSEIKTILPVKNMFGFNFVTKIMPLIDFNAFGASDENPFGNMMPLMLMSNMMDGEQDMMQTMLMMNMMNGGSMDMQSMLPLMLLTGDNNNGDMMQNILMMNMMSGGEMDMQSMMPLMLMSGNKDINPMMLMMLNGDLFGKKEIIKNDNDLEELKAKLGKDFQESLGNSEEEK